MNSKVKKGRFFEDFDVDQKIIHATPRTISEGDVALYIALTGSRFILHSSMEVAKAVGYKGLLVDNLLVFHIAFGKTVADISLNAIANLALTAEALEAMEMQGVQTIVCGSNHPFASLAPSDTTLQRDADTRFAVVADFIANLGAAYAFGFQMQRSEPAPYPEFFQAVGRTVEDAVGEAVTRAGSADRGLLGAALDLGLERIGHGGLPGKKPG